jgi:TPR repeat protein
VDYETRNQGFLLGVAFTLLAVVAIAVALVARSARIHEEVVATNAELAAPREDFGLERGCSAKNAQSCMMLGAAYQHGQNRPIDLDKARAYYDRACMLGDASGCVMRDTLPQRGWMAATVPTFPPMLSPPPAPTGTAPFDQDAAAAALASVSIDDCKQPGGPTGTGTVTVTFSPTGNAASASLQSPPFAGTPVGSCIASRYAAARVPAFAGSPVSIPKTFTLR